MKTKIILFFALSTLSTHLAMANSATKISAPEFSSKDFLWLSQQQQIQFINELRDIVVDADLRTEYFASLLQNANIKSERDIASASTTVYPSGVTERVYTYDGPLPKNIGYSEEAFKAFAEKAKSGASIDRSMTGELTNSISILIADLKTGAAGAGKAAVTAQLNSILERASKYKLDDSTKIFITGQLEILKRKEFGIEAKVPSGILIEEAPEQKVVTVQTKDPEVKSVKDQAARKTHQPQTGSKVSAQDSLGKGEEILDTKNKQTQVGFYSCLYGGFVVKEKCQPARELPSEFAKTFLAGPDFQCEKPSAMCNPILFGFEVDKKSEEACEFNNKWITPEKPITKECGQATRPVCIETSVNMSQECGKRAESSKYAGRAALLVQRSPELLDIFLKDLTQMCDKKSLGQNSFIWQKGNGEARKNTETVRKDIERTCGVVMARLASLSAAYIVVGKDATKQLNSIQLPDGKVQK